MRRQNEYRFWRRELLKDAWLDYVHGCPRLRKEKQMALARIRKQYYGKESHVG